MSGPLVDPYENVARAIIVALQDFDVEIPNQHSTEALCAILRCMEPLRPGRVGVDILGVNHYGSKDNPQARLGDEPKGPNPYNRGPQYTDAVRPVAEALWYFDTKGSCWADEIPFADASPARQADYMRRAREVVCIVEHCIELTERGKL